MIIQDISFKNFLSFGNNVNTIKYQNGINIIIGKDIDNDKSNGSGKSSAFVDSLSFALFGQTTKEIKQSRIINSQNKKNCEVILNFEKDNNKYTILRALKPNKLEVYKNDVLIDPPTNKKDYQSYIESEIIGLDHKTYKMLVFLNLNNQTPILNISKAEKRAFLEKMFDLSLFTNINNKSNNKISKLNDNIKGINDVILVNTTKIDMFKERLNQLATYDFTNIRKELKSSSNDKIEVSGEIETLKLIYEENKHEYGNAIISAYEQKTEINRKIDKLINENNSLQQKIVDIKNKDDEDTKKLKKLNEMLEKCSINDEEYNRKGEVVKSIEEDIEKLNEDISSSKHTIKSLNDKLDKINQLDGLSQCPMCDNVLDEEHTKKEIENINNDFIIAVNIKDAYIISKDNLINKRITSTDEIKRLDEIKKKRDIVLSHISSIDIKDNTYIINEYEQTIKENTININTYTTSINELENTLKELSIKKKENEEVYEKINVLNKKLSTIEENILELKNILSKEDELNTITSNISVLKKEDEVNIVKLNKFRDLLGYFKFIKEVCGDENVKSYAISNMIPFVNKKLNEYISVSGHPFYIELNDWMEAEIKGIGINDYDYGNLSSGEAKCVDLSLQFAFLDLARLQLNCFPDVLLLDEILDGSIDSNCLDRITSIIEENKRKYNNKIYIISHRDNIKNINADNFYLIEKKNGFSNIKIL